MYDIYSIVNKHIIYPLYFWRSGDKRLSRLKEMEENQYLPVKELEKMQMTAFRKLLTHANDTCPHYTQALAERQLTPDDFQSISDLQKLPVLTKSIIQNEGDSLISAMYPKESLLQDSSGGSTGSPTVFYKNLERERLRAADQLRHDRWSGWDIGDPFALIWGASKDLKGFNSFRENLIHRYVFRIIPLDAFDLNNEIMTEYKSQLEKSNPPMILGYANALYQFAKFLERNHPNHNIRPKGIISSAETLTEEARECISRTFKCNVLNRYGSREVGLVASECQSQTGLHINMDNVIIEILDDNGNQLPNGESGNIVVTDLWNFGMPLIRYRMEDRGYTLGETCSCGRTLSLIGKVEGRRSDFMVAQDGKLVHGEYFTHLFYGEPEVLKFQLIQESIDDVVLKIVLKSALPKNKMAYFEADIKKMLGENTNVDIQIIDSIPPTASGKHLFTISKVKV